MLQGPSRHGRGTAPPRPGELMPRAIVPTVRIFTIAALWAAAAAPAMAQSVARPLASRNYAFLVACAEYDLKELTPLKFTRNDLNALYRELRSAGFDEENIVFMHDE